MKLDIHAIIDLLKSDPSGISSKFGIPLRTVYGWCNGNRTPPEYVLMMMLNIILLERRLKIYGNEKEELEIDLGAGSSEGKEACKKSKSET